MTYVVVVRKDEVNGATAVYRGDSLPDIIRRLHKRYCPPLRGSWKRPKRDLFISRHYKVDMSAEEIAEVLTARGQRVTKNMVINRARTLEVSAAARRGRRKAP